MSTDSSTIMSARTSFLFFTLLLAYARGSYDWIDYDNQLDEAEYPKNLTTLESLKEFVRLVDHHKMNVSLILSSSKNYGCGNLKEAIAMTMTFPVNSETIKTPTLNKDDFVKLAEAANKDKITVGGSNAKDNHLAVITNNKKGLPITKAYKIFTGIKNGKTGFVFDEENYVAQYTFITPGSEGKNQTTKVLYGDVDVEVVDKSANLEDKDVVVIKKALVDAYFFFEEELVPRALFASLSKALPGHDWEVAGDVGEHSYLDSTTWAHLKILTENYLVYAI